MNEIPEEIVKLAESGEVKLKTTKPQEVVYAVHKGSYQKRSTSDIPPKWENMRSIVDIPELGDMLFQGVE